MLDRIRRTLSYANVMSTIAVFAVLGGGAYAATKVGPKDIKKNAVHAKHIKKNQIASKHLKRNAVTRAKIRAGAVDGSKLADDSVSGAKVDEATLGIVPNAGRLDGLDSLSFVRGGGRIFSARGTDAIGGGPSSPVALDIGGTFTLTCNNPASIGSDFTFSNTSGGAVDVWTDRIREISPVTSVTYQSVASNGTASVSVSGPNVSDGRSLVRFTIATPTRVSTIEARLVFDAGQCRFVALITEIP